MASEPVLIDTSCWIEYFNRPEEKTAKAVRALIEADRAVLNGVVLAELLRGSRTARGVSELRYALGAVARAEISCEVYGRAGSL